jgi:hypothetical protein
MQSNKQRGKGMKIRTLAILVAVLVIAALCCAGCLQELPLGDKYINEAVGHLRVQNTSTDASYIIIAVELRNSAGEVIKTWEGLGQDGQGLQKGETWIGDLDLEGSFILYCTVKNTEEETTGTFKYEYPVEIKLHEVADSGITGDLYLSTTDTDGDGFSDFWENTNNFNPEDPSDGGRVYVSSTAEDKQLGTADYPYFTLADGVAKAKRGLTEAARTVVVTGKLTRTTEGARSTDTAVFSIDDTGLHGVTIVGEGESLPILDATRSDNSMKRALYLGLGTKLTLENITIIGGYAYRGAGIHADGADLTLGQGVVIQNCATTSGASSGAGVYASGGASVLMKSGSLIGDDDVSTIGKGYDKANTGWLGVGVALLDGSSLTMENGSRITGSLFLGGGAVSADLGSTVTLKEGAEITGNKSNQDSTLTTNHGGGVRLTRGSKLIMKGGLIADNIITKNIGGGGVYVGSESVFEMEGGEIRGNSVGKAAENANAVVPGNGGGVYVDTGGIFRMSGGTIAGNTATGLGGGVYVKGGRFFKTGGSVYGSGDSGANIAGAGAKDQGHAFFGETGNPADKTLSDSFSY